MNKLDILFAERPNDLLAIYFTAGYPALNDTTKIIKSLQDSKVDIIEVGVPYSDPLADGETIQETSQAALRNGIKLDIIFSQLESIKDEIEVPLVLMGYYNQMLKYGAEKFLKKCEKSGVSGLIIPDLPVEVYQTELKPLFEKYNQKISFLITPQTKDERILEMDEASTGFLYMVSSAATTGASKSISREQLDYFNRVAQLDLKSPRLIGFGISDAKSYSQATEFANGAIVGSAFLRALKGEDIEKETSGFIESLR